MFTVEELRKNYDHLADDQIIKLATGDVQSLTEEAVIVLKEHILKRNFGKHLISYIDNERNFFSQREKEELLRIIRHLPCPRCHQDLERLTGHSSIRRTGLLLGYVTKEKELILCPRCSRIITINDTIYSAILGWWNAKSFFMNFYDIGNNIYKSFNRESNFQKITDPLLLKNTSFLRAHNSDKAAIQTIVNRLYKVDIEQLEQSYDDKFENQEYS